MAEAFETLLAITLGGNSIMAPQSGVGITQTLEYIDAVKDQLFRDVNGNLVDLTPEQFRKYRSSISCTWRNAPALDGVFPGAVVVVDCIQELSYRTAGGSPARTVVSGSSRVSGDFTFYRPQLTMMVKDHQPQKDEWEATVGWRLDLEEV
jgi:hypothetical protein